MHDAAIEPSSPARYPDSVAASCAALSADLLQRGDDVLGGRRAGLGGGRARRRRRRADVDVVGFARQPGDLVGQRLGVLRPLRRTRRSARVAAGVSRRRRRRWPAGCRYGPYRAVSTRSVERPVAAAGLPHAAPVTPSAARAAAPTSMRRLLTTGRALGTAPSCHCRNRRCVFAGHAPRDCSSPACSLAYRWPGRNNSR